ncbi:MAG: ABC transporter ATP-binding protein [Planctomycetota bacterium]
MPASLLLDALTLAVTALVGMAVLAFYHPFLLGYDIALLIAIGLTLTVVGRGAVNSAIKESKAKYRTAAWLEELARLSGTFRQFGGPNLAMRNADRIAGDYLTYRGKHFGILLRQIVTMLLLQAVASTVLLGLGGALVIRGQLNLGQLVAAELIVALVVGAFAKLTKHVEAFYDLLAGVDKLGVLLDLPRDQCAGVESPGEVGEPIAIAARDLVYGAPDHPLPRHTDFEIAAGERVALVGPSGSGKSMLCEVLAGQRARLGGQLTIDDFAPEELRPAARASRIAYVRGNEVFAATVAENIACGRPDVTNAVVRDVLTKVGLLDAVLAAGGLETALTAEGHPLTDAQCRRLSLARAIAGRPGLIIVDGLLDGFADDEIEMLVDVLTDREAPWTLIVVTGRAAIRDACDRVIDVSTGSDSMTGLAGAAVGGDNGNGHSNGNGHGNGNGNGHHDS